MAIIAYRKTDGIAHDLRFVKREQMTPEDIEYPGNRDTLPDIETLHDPAVRERKALEVPAPSELEQLQARVAELESKAR